eukprot:167631-Chlamydomonas_euryale.AAC.4
MERAQTVSVESVPLPTPSSSPRPPVLALSPPRPRPATRHAAPPARDVCSKDLGTDPPPPQQQRALRAEGVPLGMEGHPTLQLQRRGTPEPAAAISATHQSDRPLHPEASAQVAPTRRHPALPRSIHAAAQRQRQPGNPPPGRSIATWTPGRSLPWHTSGPFTLHAGPPRQARVREPKRRTHATRRRHGAGDEDHFGARRGSRVERRRAARRGAARRRRALPPSQVCVWGGGKAGGKAGASRGLRWDSGAEQSGQGKGGQKAEGG